MRILGLSSFTHDTSAALLEDGVVRAAVEESKLLRTKSTSGLPDAAIQFCLRTAGVTWRDLDYVAVSSRPLHGWLRRSLAGARIFPLSPIAAAYCQVGEIGRVARELGNFRTLRHPNEVHAAKVVEFEHHLCHAANAFFLSPFDRALILTMDEEGDGRSAMLAVGTGNRIRAVRSMQYPHSLAWLYSQVTSLLGFTPHADEHKTQWLSLEGKPEYRDVFHDMLRKSADGLPRVDPSYLSYGAGGHFVLSSKFRLRIGMADPDDSLSDEQRRALAATVQQVCTEIVIASVDRFRKQQGIDAVCLAGGLFQNPLLVHALEQSLGLNQVFVPPASGNAGCSVGAALLLHHHVLGAPRTGTSNSVYLGPSYKRAEIKDILDNCKARASLQTTEERRSDALVELLQAGKIIAWFQGAAEFGPRALGNRSVLASPWAPYVKENLNDFIKHREWFRPFALSIPEEDAPNYFECSRLCRSMSSMARVRPDVQCLPEAFVLPGNIVRLHLVERRANPELWGLLKHFGLYAPAPILINTSFNLFGEPLVVSPLDAIRSYHCSGIDALMINNFLLSKVPFQGRTKTLEYSGAKVST
ncbi:MAG: carbamoyltransferase C-terminal domain-containing protein [Candidatus Sulfotelmatobacter sp.]|jgi:carbamoyltransferase